MITFSRAILITAVAAMMMGSPAIAQGISGTPLAQMTTSDWSVEIVTEDLNYPWDIAQSGDVVILTEAAGNIVMIEGGQLERYALETSDPIVNEGGGGLLGMALAADFATSGTAYFFHSYRTGEGLTNKIIEARFDGSAWRETRVLLDGIPGHRLYNGGRVAIGPDGHLYVTTGWTENRERPQDAASLAGKVLRMTLDGEVPADNPIEGSVVYSLGHRNPQGIAWNEAGDLFVVEHGQSARDEINLITPGANYGWPLITGDEQRDGMQPAYLHSGSSTWGPSGAAFAGSQLLVANLVGRGLYALDQDAMALREIFSSGDRLRQVLPTEDHIYLITTNRSPRAEGPSEDRLIRLSPNQ